jgi:hypothetical protein
MISFRMSSPLRQIVHNRTQSQRRQAYHNSGWVRGARLGASMMPLQVVTGVILGFEIIYIGVSPKLQSGASIPLPIMLEMGAHPPMRNI